jgi:DNA end-binding protein Ku
MAAPAFWKGYLKFSLVTCPVSLTPATTEGEKVRFHTINKATGRRVRSTYVDAETGKPVDDDDQVKGYESTEGQFVIFDDAELDAVSLESVRTIDLDQFAPSDSVPWIFYDSPYYVTPNDKVGEEAYAVIRDAMERKNVVGISRVVMFRRPARGGLARLLASGRDEFLQLFLHRIVHHRAVPRLRPLLDQLRDHLEQLRV